MHPAQLSDSDFKAGLMDNFRPLRAFAFSLCGRADRADDLVQETLTKAWANRGSFAAGTNMRAWLFTILRNDFYTLLRKRRREVEDADGAIAAGVGVAPEQYGHLDMNDMRIALAKLPDDQREALLLVTASDLAYEEAAAVCGVAVGTIKSRVNRARKALAGMLAVTSAADYAPEAAHHAAMAAKGGD